VAISYRWLVLLVLLALGTARAGASGDDLLIRMVELNPNLHSYTATMKAHVALVTFLPLTTDLVGTYYHKDPDYDKLVITSGLPSVARQFDKLYPHIEPPSRWSELFVVTKTGDDAGVTTYRLVPRKQGNVDRIDVGVDDRTATISTMRWNYGNGGWAEMRSTYGDVQGNVVAVAQTGEVNEPGYKATITTTLSHYTFNPRLSDSIFAEH
jgi:outer membrane lipoprotein-sorting protein